jgi:penicillin-binding protein 1B
LKKKNRKRQRRKSRRIAPRIVWSRWLLLCLVGVTLAGVLYVVYLDRIVQLRFEGRRWSIPAKVYGRPLLLQAGAEIDSVRMTRELEHLGYRREPHPNSPGTYSSHRGRFLLRSRPFRFPDGYRSSDYLELRFSEGRMVSLNQAATQQPLDSYRLEPRLVGSLHPGHSEDRILLRRDQLPELLVQTLITIEDRRFYRHRGVDLLAILRAALANLRSAGVVQGGSTITQQLVKNFFLTPKRTLWRKLNEIAMAVILEIRYSKDDILEAYANEIYLGQDGGRAIHGFGLASHFYFNQPLNELGLPQVALLVAMVRGPSAYDPMRHPKHAKKRRELVLKIMAEQGVINQQQMKLAAASPLGVQQGYKRISGSPAFMDLVRRQLRRNYAERDLAVEGLRIFSTLDPWLQSRAELALTDQLKKIERHKSLDRNVLQGAVVLARADTGDVLALVGDRKPDYAGFNRALDALRPVGSLIKPAVYLTALRDSKRYQLLSELNDAPITVMGEHGKPWSPNNYDRLSYGPVSLITALARSYNQATVRLGMEVGLEKVQDTAKDLGIQRPLAPYPSLLLGAVSLSPLEMTQFYQTLAARGKRAGLRSIEAVTDQRGTLLSRYQTASRQTVPAAAVYLLNHALQATVQEGTARGLPALLPQGVRIAGKTGTTDDLRDSWFAGFDQHRVAVVWVGRDDNKPAALTGASGAMRVWAELMKNIGVSSLSNQPPAGVELVEIDFTSGLRGEGCQETAWFPYVTDTAPEKYAPCSDRKGSAYNWLLELFE